MCRKAPAGCATAGCATKSYRGVSCHRESGRWRAYVYHGSERHELGYYDDPREAARAHDQAARYFRGDEARVSFPDTQAFSPAEVRRRSRRKREAGSSIYRGVHLLRQVRRAGQELPGQEPPMGDDRWEAHIQHKGKVIFLGHYARERHAALAYDAAALHLFGERADTNFDEARPLSPADVCRRAVRIAYELGQRSSRYRGVWWDKRRKNWKASIEVQRKKLALGAWQSEEKAARMYDAAARHYYAEDAFTNFESEGPSDGPSDGAAHLALTQVEILRRSVAANDTSSRFRGVSWVDFSHDLVPEG